MLAAAAVAVAAAVSQRCRAQSMLQLDTETKITRFVNGQNLSVPLGVPAQPAIPAEGPYFSNIMENGLLCYTGTATGALAQEDCKCELADQMAASTTDELRQRLEKVASDVFEFENQGDATGGRIVEDFIENSIRNALNEGTDVCSQLTHLPSPATVFPSREAYETFLENNLTASDFHLRTIGIVGRQCYSPVVGTTAEQRSSNPPKMAPWEYRYTDSGASACNCRDPIEHRSESFPTTSDIAHNYIQALVANRVLRANGLPHGNPGRPPVKPQKQLSSCAYFRSGYAFQNADTAMVTPLLQGASSTVNLTLLSRESNVPFFPGATHDQEEACGGMGITERINNCFFGLLDDFSTEMLPSQEDIDKLSATCALTTDAVKPFQQKCCHKVKVYTRNNPDPELKPIIRLDMMRAVQCRRVKESVNSGDGRLHTYKPTAFSRPADTDFARREGSAMPDLTAETTAHIRTGYEDSGYHETCLLPGQQELQCQELEPATLGSSDITAAGRPAGEGLAPGGDTTRGATDNSNYRSNKIDDAKAQRTLRRSRALLNTCHLPGVYADGSPVGIDACSVAALFGLQPHIFGPSQADRGYTDESFSDCRQEEVPAIVEAYYRWKFPSEVSPAPSEVLIWWAKNRPSFYHGSASVPLVLSDYLVSEERRCLKKAPGRQQPPEGDPDKMTPATEDFNVRVEVDDGVCTTRPSCCPGAGDRLTDDQCDQVCTDGMDPLEHTTATLGARVWAEIIKQCAESNPNDKAFCKFAGQHSFDASVWKPTGDQQPLFQSVGSPGQRLCISDESEQQGLIEYKNLAIGGKTIRVAVFQTASPRTRSSVFHPIAQGTGSVGFGGINYTDVTDPSVAGWTQSSADPGAQSIPVVDGAGNVVMKLMPTLEQPVGGSFAYRGTEAAAVASTTCFTENHRGARPEGGPIRMPGLFPRTLDLEMGWGSVESCATVKNNDVIQALADQPLLDLTGRGGGSSPQFAQFTDLMYAWAAGVSRQGLNLDTTAQQNSGLWIHGNDDHGGEVMADSGGLVCATQEPNRCVGPCNLAKTIATGVVGGVEVVLGGVLNPFSDFGLFAKFLGILSVIGGGSSIMDAAGASSGNVGLTPVSKVLNARLTDTADDSFLVRTTLAQTDDLLGLYQTFPSMVWGCDPAATDGTCLGTDASLMPMTHASSENPISSNVGVSQTSQATMEAHDVWTASVSLQKSMTVGGNLACRSVMQPSGGGFKNSLGQIQVAHVQTYRSSGGSTIEFGVVDEATMAAATDGTLYTLLDGANTSASLFPDRDASCSLCASIGSPHATTAVRDECNIDAPDGTSTPTAFSLTMGVFVDNLAAAPTGAFPEDLSEMTKVCLYNFMTFGGDDDDGEIECSSDSRETTNPVDNLLGYHVAAQKPTRGPCFWSNDLVESCAFDSSLEVKTDYTLQCYNTPVDANTSCANPRWNNDKRVVFASPVRTNKPNVLRQTTDFDPLALYTSYCANNWGVVDGEPFADNAWFRSPYGYTDDIPGAPNISNVPRWLDESTAYVYCAGDRLSPEARDDFCRGSGDQPEGRGTYEGLRLQNRQDLDEVCHDTGARSHKCLLYSADPGPYAPEKIQTILDAYQEDAVDVSVVPVNFTVVSWAALFLGFTETTYYNSASQAPPSERTEAGADTIVGRLLNISWAASLAMVEGMCTSTPDLEYFAQLYAWIELHRDGPTANTYTFFSLDTGTDRTAERTVTMTDREVYPGVKLPGTVFPRLARLTLRSAFSDAVAKRASEIVGTGVALPPRWLHFHPSLVGARCTRFSAQLTATFEWLSFAMDGPCTRATPSDRVPIVYQGGSSVDNSTVKFCRCYSCSAGLVSFRGSATTVEVTASPDLDTENTVVGWSEMVPQVDTACAGKNLSVCMNASLPGLSVSLARTVGAAAVVDCGLWSTATTTDAGASQIHDVYCDLATNPAPLAVSSAQDSGGRFSGGNGLPCSNACDPDDFPGGSSPNDYCHWRQIRWECHPAGHLNAHNAPGSEDEGCPWESQTEPTAEPCVPFAWAFAVVGGQQYPETLPFYPPPTNDQIQQWAVTQIAARAAQRRCSAVGCPRAPQAADGGTCAAPLAGSDGLRQEWFLAPDEAGVPSGVPFNGRLAVGGDPATAAYGTGAETAADAGRPVALRLPQRPGAADGEAYATVLLRSTSNDVAGGRFFVDGLKLGTAVADADGNVVSYKYDDGNCLSRSTRPTQHARLEAQPCSEGVPAQQWLFVWHPDRALWRLQSASPWECITQTDPADAPAGGAAPAPVVVPCEACAVGIPQSDVVLPATTSIVVPELLPAQTDLADTEALIPLSTANASLALRVDTATGLCVEHDPPATAPTVGSFVLGVVGADALTYVPCGLLFLTGRQQLEATYGPDVCRQEPIGALLKACGLDGGQLGLVDGTPADMAALCGASLADGPDHAPMTGLRWAATSAGGGSGAVVACWPPARDPAHPASQMAPDQVGVGAGWSLAVEHGGHGFREGERLVLTGIGHGNAAPSDVRLYARVAKVVWQPFRAGLGSTPIVSGAEVINTTELYSIEGIGAVYALVSAASRSALGTWTVVAAEIVTISVVLLVHVLSCFPSVER